MPLCSVCFQPECPDSNGEERPAPSTHSTRLEPGERDYRGYIDWAVHPEEAVFVLHRGYAVVNGTAQPVWFDHNEAYVTQIQVRNSGSHVNFYEGNS
jgi:hypothetical protein